MIKRFLAYYKPHGLLFSLDMAASLLVSLIGIVYPIITREMLNKLIPDRNYRLIVIFGISLLLVFLSLILVTSPKVFLHQGFFQCFQFVQALLDCQF